MKNRRQAESVCFRRSVRRMAALCAIVVAVCAGSASADTYTWSTNTTGAAQDGSGTWNTSTANWVGVGDVHTAWNNASGDTAVFGAGGTGGTVTASSGITVGGLTFNAVASNTYTLAGGPLVLTGTPVFTANTNAAISSVLTGLVGFVKTGNGTLTLSGANTFTGNLVVAGGTAGATLQVNVDSPTATGLGNMTIVGRQVQVNGGATLLFANNDPIGSATVLQNTSFVVDGGTVNHGNYFVTMPNILLTNGATLTGGNGVYGNYQTYNLMGSVTVSGTSGSTITTTGSSLTGVHLGNGNNRFIVNPTGSDPDLTVIAPLVNRPGSLAASGFIKTGAGKMMLAADNAFSGAITVSNGVLQVGSGGAMGSVGTGAGGVALVNADATLVFNRSGTLTQAGAITGSGSLLKQGTGVVTLSGANSYSGGTTVSNGVLAATTTNSLPGYATAGKVTVGSGAGLSVGVGSWSNADITSLVNTGAFGSGALFGFDTTAGNYTYSGQFALPAVAGLVKTGPNALTLSGSTGIAGGVTALGGILRADFGAGIPAATNVTLNGASLSSSSGSITAALGAGAGQITVAAGTASGFSALDVPLTVNLGGAGAALSWGSSLFNPSVFVLNDTGANTNLVFANGLDLNSTNRTLTVNASEAAVNGVIANGSGAAGLVKNGAGTLRLTAANTFTGGMTVNAGTLALSGGNDRLSTSGALTVSNGKLDLGGNSQTTAGAVVLDNAVVTNGTLSKSGAVYDVRSGTIAANLAGSVGLTKSTAGTLVLSGLNTYTGNTLLNGGATWLNGGTVSNAAYFDIGAVNSPATFLFSSGAITAGSQFVIGAHGTSSGIQSNGTLQVNGTFYMGGYGEGTGTGTYTQVGGKVTVTGSMSFNGGGPNSGIYNLAGGSLTLAFLQKLGGTGAGTFNFNGGTLKPSASSATFMQGLTAANVQSGGAILDTVGYDVTINQSLLHGAALGAQLDGGLAKLGSGTLTLTGTNSYNGTTTVSNGTLRLGASYAITNGGALRVAGGVLDLGGFAFTNGTVTLNSGSIINGSLNAFSYALTDTGTIQANLSGGALTKSGAGTVVLLGGNTCTGAASVAQGTLTLADFGNSNCRLRLDASDSTTLATNANGMGAITASGQQVGYWGDLSGNGKPATQATTNNRPTYVANGADFNGRSVLQFDGVDDDITSLLDINATSIPNITIIMVYKQLDKAGNGGLWGHDNGSWDRLQLFYNSPSYYQIATANSSASVKGMETNKVTLYSAVLKNGVTSGSYVYINGRSDSTCGLPAFTSQESAPYGYASFTLGNISAGNGYRGKVQIGEVLVYDTALSDSIRRNVEAYLRNKWLGASDPITPGLPTNAAVQVATGAVLNLDGTSHTVASVSGGGIISNGSLRVTGTLAPGGTNTVGTLSFSLSPVLSGATLLADAAADGSGDQLAVTGNLSLTGLTLQIANTGLLNRAKTYAVATCTGTLTGRFVATNLPANWYIRYNQTSATLYYANPGTMIRVM